VNGQTATWSTWREALAVVSTRRTLLRTASTALIVGTTFFAMNQLNVIIAGQATTAVWLKSALTYLTPLVVSNVGVLSATRRHDEHTRPLPAG